MTPLRRRMTEDMILRNLAPGTIRQYVNCVAGRNRFNPLGGGAGSGSSATSGTGSMGASGAGSADQGSMDSSKTNDMGSDSSNDTSSGSSGTSGKGY